MSKRKIKQTEVLSSYSSYISPFPYHTPNLYLGTKTWNSKHQDSGIQMTLLNALATSYNNSGLSTGSGRQQEHRILWRSARARTGCPLGLETSQKGKGQMHPSPSLQVSNQWDYDKSRQRKLEVERQRKKASTGWEENCGAEGATQGRERLVQVWWERMVNKRGKQMGNMFSWWERLRNGEEKCGKKRRYTFMQILKHEFTYIPICWNIHNYIYNDRSMESRHMHGLKYVL